MNHDIEPNRGITHSQTRINTGFGNMKEIIQMLSNFTRLIAVLVL